MFYFLIFLTQQLSSKDTVESIVDLLLLQPDLIYDNNRGLPLSPAVKVCIALGMYGGGHFQRIAGLCGGVSQYAARQALVDVTNSLLGHRNEFIFMPSIREMENTADKMWHRFHLPRFALAVDGVMLRFQDAPRNLPAGKHQQQYWCRKQFYAINTQVVGNDRYICDIDVRSVDIENLFDLFYLLFIHF